MPTTTEAHRVSIGLFYPIWCGFSTENDEIQTEQTPFSKVFTKRVHKLVVCMTLSVLYCLFVLLLTQCMDVEKNPGPGPDHTYTSMFAKHAGCHEWRFFGAEGSLQSYTAGISKKMDDNFGRLDRTFGQLLEDVVGLKTAVQQDKEDIRELQEDRDNVTHRLDRTEKELDSLKGCQNTAPEISWRDGGTARKLQTSIEGIVDILNECLSSRTWDKSDIEMRIEQETAANEVISHAH